MKTRILFITIIGAIQLFLVNYILATDIKLAGYPFPITTASFSATEVAANIQMSNLTYTDNLMYDYNSTNGYFRPYRWPEGTKDPDTYLEFRLTPQSGAIVNISNIQIVHKPNNATLGPSKISLSYSTDDGIIFTPVAEKTIVSRTTFNTDAFTPENLNTNQPIIFRIYAYESLYGTVTQKDLWIIDNIGLYGSVQGGTISTTPELKNNNGIKFFYSNNGLLISNVLEETKLTIYNLIGRIIKETAISTDQNIELNNVGSAIVVKTTSESCNKTVKVLCR